MEITSYPAENTDHSPLLSKNPPTTTTKSLSQNRLLGKCWTPVTAQPYSDSLRVFVPCRLSGQAHPEFQGILGDQHHPTQEINKYVFWLSLTSWFFKIRNFVYLHKQNCTKYCDLHLSHLHSSDGPRPQFENPWLSAMCESSFVWYNWKALLAEKCSSHFNDCWILFQYFKQHFNLVY